LKKMQTIWIIVCVAALILSACSAPSRETPTPTQNADAVFTAAAQTANARITENAAQKPSPTPQPPTDTPTPTNTLAPTQPLTPTATLAPTASAGTDKALYVTDVTIPDGTTFQPGDTFKKTWQIKNAGTSTWTTSYRLAYVAGDQMGGPASVPVPSEVGPGQTVDVSVDLKAPADGGEYTGYWRMMNASGKLFDSSVYVKIDVSGSGTATVTPTPGTPGTPGTGTPTSTSGPGTPTITPLPGGGQVSSVEISVDEADVTGTCPHTFTFTAAFTLDKAATVTYQLEADTGGTVTLPPAVTDNFPAGVYSLVYNLDFTASVQGWARLHITAPNDITSDKVNFSLTCQ
jgi:Ig-like domain from next to BRCA1 gene